MSDFRVSATTTPVLIADNYQPTDGSVDAVNTQLTKVGNTPIDAALEIQSTSGALVIPRLRQAVINDLTMVSGGIVYNLDTNEFNMYANGTWYDVGTGSVYGPPGAVQGHIATFADNTGNLLEDSGVDISQVPALSIPQKNLLKANFTVNEISNLARIAFNEDVSIIFNNSLNAIQFINNNFGGLNEQCCLVLTGIAPPPSGSTTPSCLLELQSDTGALVVSRMSTADITSANFFPTDGMVVYDTDQKSWLFRENGAWRNLDNSTSNPTQSYVAQLSEGYNQGGFGSGSVGADKPLRTNSFSFFDTTTVNSNSKGFAGGVFDGEYIYLIPNKEGSSGQITRFKVSEPFGSASSYATFDLTSFNSGLKGFSGAVFDGRYIYYIPFNNNGAPSGQVVQFDTKQSFFSASSYSVFDLTSVDANAKGFWGGLYHDGYVYFCPFSTTFGSVYSGLVVRYNTTLPFTNPASYQKFDLTTINGNLAGFEGMVCDGTGIYFIPSQNAGGAHGHIVLYDSGASFTNAGSYFTFDATTVSANAKGFVGGIFDGRFVYFVPNNLTNGSVALRYDITKNFTTSGSYSTFDLSTLDARCKGFIGACFDGRYVYFVPNNNGSLFGKVVQYDISQDFTLSSSYLMFDSSSLNANSVGFYGSVYDGKYVYLIPCGVFGNFLGQITRINAYTGPQLNYYFGFSASGVTAGSYTYATVTVDSEGMITAAASGTNPVLSVSGTAGQILSSGGQNPIISLATAGTAGSYNYPTNITTDAYGRATSITAGVAPVTSVSGTAGQIASTGGTTPILSLSSTAVSPGSYTFSSFTVDSFGRLTAASSGIPVTQVNTGTGLSGGPITSTGTISIANTTVTAGSYTYGSFTVNAQGQLTAASSGTSPVTSINTGTGLTGGPITSTGTISIANTTVTAGSYTYASLTVNAQGQLTAASSGTAPVTSVSGTAGNITSSGGTTPIINLATAGTAGTYSFPSSMTTDTFGRVTSVTSATTATAEVQISSTLAYNLQLSGTQTAQTANTQTCLYVNPTMAPSSAISNYLAGSAITPTITVPNVTNPAISYAAGEYISLTINGTSGKIVTNSFGLFVGAGSLSTATVTNSYGGFFTNPGFGTNPVALYADNLSVGYAATTPPTSGAIFAGAVGVGVNSITNSMLKSSSNNAYNLHLLGSQTAQTSNRQICAYINPTLTPTAQITGDVTALSVEPTVTVPNVASAIAASYGEYLNVTINGAAQTVTNSYGLFVDQGSLSTATVTNAYGGYFKKPNFGGSSTALYADNLSIGYTASTPITNGASISGGLAVGSATSSGGIFTSKSTLAYNATFLGSQTAIDSNRQVCVDIIPILNPSSQVTGNVTALSVEPTITVPNVTNPAIANGYGEYINLTINGTAGKILTSSYGLFVDVGSLATASVTNAYGGYFKNPAFGSTSITALYADNLSIGYTGVTPPSSGAIIGTLGVGTSGPNANAILTSSSTLAYNLLLNGTQTGQSSNRQVAQYIAPTLAPSAQITGNVTALSVEPNITVPNVTNPAIANAYGGYYSLVINGTAGKTLTNTYGLYVDQGSLATASVTNAYGGYFVNPAFGGSSATALYTDNLSIGYANTTPPSNGAIISGTVGIGASNPSASKLLITATSAFNTRMNGTQTAQNSNRQICAYVSPTLAPAAQVTGDVTALSVEPTITMPNVSNPAIAAGYGGYFNIKISGSATTMTNSYGLFVDVGSLTTASVTNAYGGYFSNPAFGGTSKTALYTDNLSIGYTGVTPPTNGFIVSGNVSFFSSGPSFGGGTQTIYIANSSTIPTSNPSGGGLLYVQSGALKYRGSSGTVTQLAVA